MALYRPLSEISLGDSAEFGGKAARLGEAMRLGCSVLPGIALSSELYRQFMRQGGLQGEVRSILATMQPQAIGQYQAAEWAIRSAFDVRLIPGEIIAVIREAWQALDAEWGAVRSSATNEDSPLQSFVGQHQYVLNVGNADAAVGAVLACWMSLYSAQALSYAHHFGVDLLSSAMGVLIQPMVEVQSRGSLFTVDPVTGNPDLFLLSVQQGPRAGIHLLDPYAPAPGEEPTWSRLREMGLQLDEHESAYQSLDWVVAEGQVYLLRARPVTGAPPYLPTEATRDAPPDTPLVWVRAPQASPRAAKPMSWFHTSRASALHQAYRARDEGNELSGRQPALYFSCGYQYIGTERSDSRPPHAISFAVRLVRNLVLLVRARRLRESYHALIERERLRLDRLIAQDWAQPDRHALADLLIELMSLHDALAHKSGLLELTDRSLTELVERVARRWKIQDGLDLDLLLAPDDGAHSRFRPILAGAGAEDRDSEHARSLSAQEFYRQYRHRFVPGEPLASWRDLADIEPDNDMLEQARLELRSGEAAPAQESESRASRREQALASLVARLGALRGPAYEWLAKLARRYRALARDSQDPVLLCRVLERDVLVEIGGRMHAASLVSSAGDARLFRYQELLDWLQGQMDDADVARIAQQRADTWRRWARYAPPDQIEPGPAMDPDDETFTGQTLTGQAICAGGTSGPARLVRDMSEASQVLPGEVLVCQELSFELTPLFSIVAAVVAEKGDLLDHASVLAREYRIPTVFGVAEATRRIYTGDSVTVDAGRGLVTRRLPEPDWDLWTI